MLSPLMFDGHNDLLMRLYLHEEGRHEPFFMHGDQGAIDLPRCREGGFGGGFFAVYIPAEPERREEERNAVTTTAQGYEVAMAAPLGFTYAQRVAIAMSAILFRIEADSHGAVRVVRTADQIERCLRNGALAAVLHFEGAEAIDTELNALEVFYAAGLRSLGIVWSRPNAFGHGVPFRFPSSPDTGPGLTDAGRELVQACNRLGIMIDLAHLNEQGFWDVARISDAPLVATHTAVHSICPSARNLTDRQIDAIGQSGGIIGLNFHVADLRADGRSDAETPLAQLMIHIDYIAERIGVEHIAFGSDYDGALMPSELRDVSKLSALFASLRAHGYVEKEIEMMAHGNWINLLRRTWKDANRTE